MWCVVLLLPGPAGPGLARICQCAPVIWCPTARWAGFRCTKARAVRGAAALLLVAPFARACHKIPNSQGRDPRTLEPQEGFAPPETARTGPKYPKRRRPNRSPFLPSPSRYCSCVSRAMEVCCLFQAGDVPTPCSSLAGQCPFDPRGACGRLMFGFWDRAITFHFPSTYTLTSQGPSPPLQGDGWKLSVAAELQLLSKDAQCRCGCAASPTVAPLQ